MFIHSINELQSRVRAEGVPQQLSPAQLLPQQRKTSYLQQQSNQTATMSAPPDHDGANPRGGGWSQAPCCRRGQSSARGHAPPPSSRACRREVSRLFDERSERLLCASDNADEQQRQPLLPPPKASPVALPRHLPMMVQTIQANSPPALLSPRPMTTPRHLRQLATSARLSTWSMAPSPAPTRPVSGRWYAAAARADSRFHLRSLLQ